MAFDHIATQIAIHISARFNGGRFRVTLAQDRAWRCAPTHDLSGLLPPGFFSAHLTGPGRFSCAGLLINEVVGS